jgi:UDP-N-acetyl-alpha-D-muramoyl-L-alanyl-L-glutamate epimerase
MTLQELRTKHPEFSYDAFDIQQLSGGMSVRFYFRLLPDIRFVSEIQIPCTVNVDLEAIRSFVFHLGLVEAISYWKAACSPMFVIKAGRLTDDQISWWRDLFIHGLGEFFYKNKIDFTKPDFLTIKNGTNVTHGIQAPNKKTHSGNLLLVSGGKDTAVTLGLFGQSKMSYKTLVVNPTIAALHLVQLAGLKDPIIIKRTLDPLLLDLNRQGYLNGHTPYSALLAFLGILVAQMYGYQNVIVSNERSANEGNVSYLGMEINHQYSKSIRFENMFRDYISSFVIPTIDLPAGETGPRSNGKKAWIPGQAWNDNKIHYFSFLRPLNDLQIARIFSMFPKFFPFFRSCNKGTKTNTWCGNCPKCAFTYLVLSPFIPHTQLLEIFGSDYFQNPYIISHIRGLVGLSPIKPFDCVGTRDESILAVVLAKDAYKIQGIKVPIGLQQLYNALELTKEKTTRKQHDALEIIGKEHNLSEEFSKIIREFIGIKTLWKK